MAHFLVIDIFERRGGNVINRQNHVEGKIMKKFNEVDYIISYEQGELSDKNTLILFSHLIKSGRAWHLQGHYGRTAWALIEDKWIDKQGKILKAVA
jgi:hypothetical protein